MIQVSVRHEEPTNNGRIALLEQPLEETTVSHVGYDLLDVDREPAPQPSQAATEDYTEQGGQSHFARIREAVASVIDNGNVLRRRVFRATIIGSFTLGIAGCSINGEEPQRTTITAERFQADPGVDAWPSLSPHTQPSNVSNDISGFDISRQIAIDASSDNKSLPEVYDYSHFNDEPPKDSKDRRSISRSDSLPSDASAPVLTVKLGGDGELRYNATNTGSDHSATEENLLAAVNANRETLIQAMQEGSLSALHLRIFKPSETYTEDEPQMDGVFITSDSNEGERPAAYVYLAAKEVAHYKNVEMFIGHETRHGLFRTEIDGAFTPEEKQALSEACVALRQVTQQQIHGYNDSVVRNLEIAKAEAPAGYSPVFDQVIQSILDGTDFPTTESGQESAEALATEDLTRCYWQSPYEAVSQLVQESGIAGFDISELPDGGERYEAAINGAVKSWGDSIKNYSVFGQLAESTLLKDAGVSSGLGHLEENAAEWISLANIIEQDPEGAAEIVAKLPLEQQHLVAQAGRAFQSALRRAHHEYPDYAKKAETAYSAFFQILGPAGESYRSEDLAAIVTHSQLPTMGQ